MIGRMVAKLNSYLHVCVMTFVEIHAVFHQPKMDNLIVISLAPTSLNQIQTRKKGVLVRNV